jgi:hypothetical protein
VGGQGTAQELRVPEVVYPVLPEWSSSAEGFVPPGWVLEARSEGDLNGDAVPDLALVLRQSNADNIVKDPSIAGDAFDTNPRILAVAFRNGPAGEFGLVVQNHTLIPRPTNPSAEDPFEDGLSIERGRLRLSLRLFMSAGGWTTFNATFTFQFRNGRFVLVGYDRYEVHRGNGRVEETSVNFLTRQVKKSTGSISSDARGKAVWTKLARRSPPAIDEISDGLDFEP